MIHIRVALGQINVLRFGPANATSINCAEHGMLHVHMGNMNDNVVVARVLPKDGVVGASSAANTDADNSDAIAACLQHCSNRSYGV